ncbi:MAG: hypothetical protein U0Y68_15800 [Blastocatellia bacterium]
MLNGLSALEECACPESDERYGATFARTQLAVERKFPANQNCCNAVLMMASDKDLRVQFQLALTLGNIKDKRAFDALVNLARRT